MKRLVLGRYVALAGGLLVAAAVAGAQDRTTGNEAMPGRSPSGPAGTASQGATGTGSVAGATRGTCEHQMTGRVAALDKARGTMAIEFAGDEDLRIQLPASELAGFEQGDEVVVSMGVKERRTEAGETGTRPGILPESLPGSVR
jgi:hypothetical protein